MKIPNRFQRPQNLLEGKTYWLRLSRDGCSVPIFTPVIFIGHTSCPAVIIVRDDRSELLRCGRDELYLQREGEA